jgi:hypothetical protein
MGQNVDKVPQARFADAWRNMTTTGKVMLFVVTAVGVVLIVLPSFVGEALMDSVLINGGTAFLLLPPLYYGQERIAATSGRQQAIQVAREEIKARRTKEQWTDQPAERLSVALIDAGWKRQSDEDGLMVWSHKDRWVAYETTDTKMVTKRAVSRIGIELGLTNAEIVDKATYAAVERARRDASQLASSHPNGGSAVALTDPIRLHTSHESSSNEGLIRRIIHYRRHRKERRTVVTGSRDEDQKL